MVKFYSFAQFPVDHFPSPFVSLLVLLLCQFAAYANQFKYLFRPYCHGDNTCILLHIINVWFYIISPLGIIMRVVIWHLVSFLKFPLANNIHVIFFLISAEGYPHHTDIKLNNLLVELWGMLSASSLPSLPCPLWPEVKASNKVLSMDQKRLNYALMLNWIVRNRSLNLHLNCVLILKLNCLN